MINNKSQGYTLEHIGGSLVFTTESFKAEKGSVLHSGVYNREMASTFVSAGAAFFYFAAVALSGSLSHIHYIAAAVIFIILYPLSWRFIFKRASLGVILNKERDIVEIDITGIFRNKRILRTLNQLKDVTISHVKIEMGNPDGVAFVEKIALQHGTVIPGFGAAEDIYAVEFVFSDGGPVTVFSTGDRDKAVEAVSGFKDYLLRG
ncbi:MAG: hypothetical protein HQL01_02115 [Nitrospirae bacterium]|nr:hypothetical protein [Nitrospirota bacterium]